LAISSSFLSLRASIEGNALLAALAREFLESMGNLIQSARFVIPAIHGVGIPIRI
jgi:hypothetical protein